MKESCLFCKHELERTLTLSIVDTRVHSVSCSFKVCACCYKENQLYLNCPSIYLCYRRMEFFFSFPQQLRDDHHNQDDRYLQIRICVVLASVFAIATLARWLHETAQHATLFSLLSAIALLVSVGNNPDMLADGVGCEVEDVPVEDTTGLGGGGEQGIAADDSSTVSDETIDMTVDEAFPFVLAELRERFAANNNNEESTTDKKQFRLAASDQKLCFSNN